MIMIVAPNPGDRLAALSTWLGVHVPNTTCRMLGLGGWGVTKNHMLEAKLSLKEKSNLNILNALNTFNLSHKTK